MPSLLPRLPTDPHLVSRLSPSSRASCILRPASCVFLHRAPSAVESPECQRVLVSACTASLLRRRRSVGRSEARSVVGRVTRIEKEGGKREETWRRSRGAVAAVARRRTEAAAAAAVAQDCGAAGGVGKSAVEPRRGRAIHHCRRGFSDESATRDRIRGSGGHVRPNLRVGGA